jgi:hypothetical protein
MNRHGNRWNVNEVLSLQREYELLEMTVQQIADKHNRSVMSIVYKLYAEGFTSSLFEARGYTEKPVKVAVVSSKRTAKRVIEDEDLASDYDSSSDFDEESDIESDDEEEYEDEDQDEVENTILVKQTNEVSEDVSEVDKLTERVWSLETSVGEIGTMVRSLFDKLVTTKSNKLQPLRKRTL